MIYTDFSIEMTVTEMLSTAMKDSTPKKYARLLLEGAEIIKQLQEEKKEKSQWIRSSEALPELNRRVLICREKEPGVPYVEQAYLTAGGWWKVFGTNCRRVDWWRPLPDPPEAAP